MVENACHYDSSYQIIFDRSFYIIIGRKTFHNLKWKKLILNDYMEFDIILFLHSLSPMVTIQQILGNMFCFCYTYFSTFIICLSWHRHYHQHKHLGVWKSKQPHYFCLKRIIKTCTSKSSSVVDSSSKGEDLCAMRAWITYRLSMRFYSNVLNLFS